MRRALSVFLVLMLVLRGLLGDAMAMGLMAGEHGGVPASQHAAHGGSATPGVTHLSEAQTAVAATAHSAHADPASTSHHPSVKSVDVANSPGHCASADAQHGATSDCDSSQHAHCAACGICHSPLGAWASLSLPHAAPAQAAPMASLPAFASAVLAQVAKPPIF